MGLFDSIRTPLAYGEGGSSRVRGAGITLSTTLVCELRKRWWKSSFYFQTIPAKRCRPLVGR